MDGDLRVPGLSGAWCGSRPGSAALRRARRPVRGRHAGARGRRRRSVPGLTPAPGSPPARCGRRWRPPRRPAPMPASWPLGTARRRLAASARSLHAERAAGPADARPAAGGVAALRGSLRWAAGEACPARRGGPAFDLRDLEERFAGQALAWIGGFALVAAAVFFLSLAFSRGWITEPHARPHRAGRGRRDLAVGALCFDRRNPLLGNVLTAVGPWHACRSPCSRRPVRTGCSRPSWASSARWSRRSRPPSSPSDTTPARWRRTASWPR